MLLLNGGHAAHLGRYLLKALFLGGLGEAGIHVRPLVVLALGSHFEILSGGADLAAVHGLIPELGVLLLVCGGLGEEGGDLLIAVLLGLRGVEFVFHAGLGFAGECCLKILERLAVLEFHVLPPVTFHYP